MYFICTKSSVLMVDLLSSHFNEYKHIRVTIQRYYMSSYPQYRTLRESKRYFEVRGTIVKLSKDKSG